MAEPESAAPGADLFLSYSRTDQEFATALRDALDDADRKVWMDVSGIRPTAKWMDEVRAAIESADAFVFVISPESVTSEVCAQEIEHAASLKKRILPVVLTEADTAQIPAPIRERNWIFARDLTDAQAPAAEIGRALDTDPEWARMHTRLQVRALEWDGAGRDPSLALRGRDLDAAEAWLVEADDRKDPQPTQLHTEYIVASRAVATQGQRRRVAALGAGLVIASALAIVAFLQFRRAEDEAEVARSRELAATSLLERETNPDLGLTLAVEAGRVVETDDAEQAIRQALEETAVRTVLRGPGPALTAVAVNADGTQIATGADDGRVTLWSAESGAEEEGFDAGDSAVNSVTFSPDGDRLALATGEAAQLWSIDEPALEVELDGHRAKVWSVAFDAGGRRIATASADGTARVWDADGEPRTSFTRHRKPVFGVAFSPNGRLLASSGRDGFVRVWDSGTGAEREAFEVRGQQAAAGQATDVNAVAFSPHGGGVVAGAADGIARLWELRRQGPPMLLRSGNQEVYGVAFRPDGERVATASLDGTVRIWDVTVGGRRATEVSVLRGHGGGINGVAYTPDGELVASASADGTARVWEAERDDAVLTYEEHSRGVLGAAFSPDGTTAVTSGLDTTARVWDVASGETEAVLRAPRDVWSPVFSPDGQRVLAGIGDGDALIWDASGGKPQTTLSGHRFRIVGADWSPTGELVATASLEGRGGARAWDAASGREVASFSEHGDFVFSIAFDPSGERVVSGGADSVARVWDPTTGSELAALEGHDDWVRDARFSPDGERVVTASEDRTARIWDVEEERSLQTLTGHTDAVLGAAFSPDGERVATASADRTVRVWDAATGQLLDILRGHDDWVSDVAFSPDGDTLLSASYDDTAGVLECALCVPFDELLALAEERVTRQLTPEERAQYLHE